jgi:choline dehydrogenase-like flavoprotein
MRHISDRSQLETYHGPGPKSVHGYDGPITVSEGTYRAIRPTKDYIQAAGQVGYPEIEDLSALDYNNGVQAALRFIGTDGLRQDTAFRYIHPKIQSGRYPGLNVLVDTQVKRVIFEGKRASGVEIRPNPKVQPNGTFSTVRARKMVIVSAGALGTPLILERSGIGNPDILKKAGIDVVVSDLCAVGENYQDHHLITYPYYTNLNEDETLDALVSGRLDAGEAIKNNASILGWNAQDVTGKLRPTEEEVASLGPEFSAVWDEDYKDNANKPLLLTALINA